MLELDGQVYTVNTPVENAAQAISWVNQYCIDNNITNLDGEIISIEVAPGSPLYLIFLAFAYLATICQNLLYGVGRMLSVASCSYKQLLNIGEIIRVRPLPQSYTTIRCLVFANDEGICSITTGLSVTIKVGSANVVFNPLFNVDIQPGTVGTVLLQTATPGSMYIAAGVATAFDVPPANFYRMQSQASTPGRPAETPSQYRRRIQSRTIAFSGIEKCVQALRTLPGISAANIFFNGGNDTTTIQGYQVDARKAIAFIQGYNDDIAKTIYSYLLCDMMPLTLSQPVTLNNGQQLMAYWEPPVAVQVAIELYIETPVSQALNTQLIDAVQSLALTVDIASVLTTAQVLDVCRINVPDVILSGASLKRSNQPAWSQRITSGANEIFEFVRNQITIVEAGA